MIKTVKIFMLIAISILSSCTLFKNNYITEYDRCCKIADETREFEQYVKSTSKYFLISSFFDASGIKKKYIMYYDTINKISYYYKFDRQYKYYISGVSNEVLNEIKSYNEYLSGLNLHDSIYFESNCTHELVFKLDFKCSDVRNKLRLPECPVRGNIELLSKAIKVQEYFANKFFYFIDERLSYGYVEKY